MLTSRLLRTVSVHCQKPVWRCCKKAQSELRFTVTGILLDEGNAGMDFSLKTLCQNIYRTSELTGDQIVREIVLDRV